MMDKMIQMTLESGVEIYDFGLPLRTIAAREKQIVFRYHAAKIYCTYETHRAEPTKHF